MLWNSLAPLLPPLPESSSDSESSENENDPKGKPSIQDNVSHDTKSHDRGSNCMNNEQRDLSGKLGRDSTESGEAVDTENVEIGISEVVEGEKKMDRSTSKSRYEIQTLDTVTNLAMVKSDRSTSNSRQEKQALDSESNSKLIFYRLDGRLDFLDLVVPKAIPNKRLIERLARGTASSRYENQALDTEGNLVLNRYKLVGEPERSTANSRYENRALDTEGNLDLTIYKLDGELDFLNLFLPARLKPSKVHSPQLESMGSSEVSPGSVKETERMKPTDTKMKTNDKSKRKEETLMAGEKFIKRKQVISTARERLSSVSKNKQVVEVFRKQALEAASRKVDERASDLDEETSHPLWSPRDLRKIFNSSRPKAVNSSSQRARTSISEHQSPAEKTARSQLPKNKQLFLSSFLKDTCTSPLSSKKIAAKAARGLNSKVNVNSPSQREPGRSPGRMMNSKQLTLDQMVLRPVNLGRLSIEKPRISDGSRSQVETGFVLDGGHDTLDL